MRGLRHRYLAEMGIPAFVLRRASEIAPAEPLDAAEERVLADTADLAAQRVPAGTADLAAEHVPAGAADADAWRALEAEVRDCRKCALHRGRTQTVFGVGRRDASLLVIGEAPGEEEDRQGEPFVGPAGRLLNAMLRAIGLSREQVYIANILKCRPPRNRDPKPEEADACSSFLDRQIAMIEPRAMLAVGRISAQRLLETEQPVGRLRGVVHRYGDKAIPLVVTYHPAYLLRTPIAKAKSWQDLCMLSPLLASSAPTEGASR